MNLKKNLKDVGYYLITPYPKKYHFEGVDNRRAARNLTIGCLALQVVALAAVYYGPVIEETIYDLKTRLKNRKIDK